MSKITFRHRANDLKSQKETPLKIRLVVSRECSLEMNSGLFVKPVDWNKPKGTPIKRITKECVKLDKDLLNLESHITNSLDEATKSNEIIDIQWLRTKVNEFHGITPIVDKNSGLSIFLIDHIKKYIELAPTKKVENKKALGLAPNTIIKYKSFLSVMVRYEKHLNKQITFKDLGKQFIDEFINWLKFVQKYSDNYSGKQIDHLKTISTNAEEYGIEVNNYMKKVKSFKEDDDDKYIVTYSFEEIEIIRNTVMPTECLENVRKWMILGFEIGQRGSDLLAIDKTKITSIDEENGYIFMDVYQAKPDKWVNVPFLNEKAINIIKNDFPYPISLQKLNKNMKKVVKICGFTTPMEGKKFNKETGRKKFEIYQKYEITTSHCLRRSFATNWYQKMETSIIMEITGHVKESQFYEYINVREDKEKGARNFAKKAKITLDLMKQQMKKSA